MRRTLALLAIVTGLIFAAGQSFGQLSLTGAGKGALGGGGGCSQATTFLARTSGLDGTHTTAYTNLICGLVTDGVWALFDVLYIFATQDATTAGLNLVSASFTATPSAVNVVFTADSGYNSTLNNIYVDSNWNFSTNGVNYTQNSAHVSGWVVGSSTSTSGGPLLTSVVDTSIYPKFTDNSAYLRVNDSSGGFANSNRQGFWVGNRSSSTARQAYLNGASVNTYGSTASSAPANNNMLFLGDLSTGDLVDTIAAASAGGDLSSVQGAYYTRMRAYMTAVGVP